MYRVRESDFLGKIGKNCQNIKQFEIFINYLDKKANLCYPFLSILICVIILNHCNHFRGETR